MVSIPSSSAAEKSNTDANFHGVLGAKRISNICVFRLYNVDTLLFVCSFFFFFQLFLLQPFLSHVFSLLVCTHSYLLYEWQGIATRP